MRLATGGSDMTHGSRTIYSVQAFRLNGNGLEPEAPQAVDNEAQALRRLVRIAAGKAGAVAVRLDGDLEAGNTVEPVVLRIIGRVPEVFLEDLPF